MFFFLGGDLAAVINQTNPPKSTKRDVPLTKRHQKALTFDSLKQHLPRQKTPKIPTDANITRMQPLGRKFTHSFVNGGTKMKA